MLLSSSFSSHFRSSSTVTRLILSFYYFSIETHNKNADVTDSVDAEETGLGTALWRAETDETETDRTDMTLNRDSTTHRDTEPPPNDDLLICTGPTGPLSVSESLMALLYMLRQGIIVGIAGATLRADKRFCVATCSCSSHGLCSL